MEQHEFITRADADDCSTCGKDKGDKVHKERKAPLGVTPRFIWLEQVNHARISELLAAMRRYVVASQPIPIAWLDEVGLLVHEERQGYPQNIPTDNVHTGSIILPHAFQGQGLFGKPCVDGPCMKCGLDVSHQTHQGWS